MTMNRCLTSALFASALMLGMTPANAAPLSATPVDQAADSGIEPVHGGHRSCRSGGGGWHRHTRDGDRVRCGRSVRVYRSEPSVSIRVGKTHRHRDHDRRRDRDGDRRDRR
jgi:hypothetical protein